VSTQKADGMNYAPRGKPNPVCRPGDFRIGAVGLDHGHIFGMCNGLHEAGAEIAWVYDPDPARVAAFRRAYPEAREARSEDEVLDDGGVHMIASASVPCDRGPLGLRAMARGKHFFGDKPPVTTLEQLAAVRRAVAETGKKFAVYFSERLHVEAAVHAGTLIDEGAVGRVLQVVGFGPHRLNASTRPAWFWDKRMFGGILCDIGSHQIEQFLHWTRARSARLLHSKVANYAGLHPGFEDFGDATFVADGGATHYLRVDWYTPSGLGAWGDGRTFIVGTDGTIELRKYVDVARDAEGDHVYVVDRHGERHLPVHGKIGFPFFGQLILDCLNGTERAMTQEHALLAVELALLAQASAVSIGGPPRGDSRMVPA
jgi:predicted dehydrogenase